MLHSQQGHNGASVTDTILLLNLVRPDGTVEKRRVRLPADGACELRIRFHEGHFAKGLLLRGIRLAADPVAPEAPQGIAGGGAGLAAVTGAARAAGSDNDH